ncbi:alpha/beta hydrolase [Eleftheria terrae]|uniref:alpha/beta hydrolase n=1 Tax=Eleftheria terrae TaxID=1597781 RepID=UPI00263A7C62|nr:alpha/beta fold hydrolase [Eleftheria terrae]WKB55909.1 alpha/beta hydrolase [Eleftheria terrae]
MPRSIDGPHGNPLLLPGPAGQIEVLLDLPAREAPLGLAVIAHPQPLLGGHARHKIPQLLARALCEAGWRVARPNFRGVGASQGVHDRGIGETDDLLAVVDQLHATQPGARLALLGFSFGAFVQVRVAHALAAAGRPAWRSCLLGLPIGDVAGQRCYATPPPIGDTAVIHGEADERAPLSAVLEWARPAVQPVTVVPGADHFFSGRLPVLRQRVLAQLSTTPEP